MRTTDVRRIVLAATVAVLVAACGSSGGNAPAGGAGPATDPPRPSGAATPKVSPLPSGDPDVDYYGY